MFVSEFQIAPGAVEWILLFQALIGTCDVFGRCLCCAHLENSGLSHLLRGTGD